MKDVLVLIWTFSAAAVLGKPNTTCVNYVWAPRQIPIRYFGLCSKEIERSWFRMPKYFFCYKTKIITISFPSPVIECCPGYQNMSGVCEKASCEPTKWGHNCAAKCPCAAGHYHRCDETGTCFCTSGWIGNDCSKACEKGKYGADCQWNCSCDNNAFCDHVTGMCDCNTVKGWTGKMCEQECPAGLYGRNCSLSCNCSDFHNPACHPVSGDCTCNSGKRGANCHQDCDQFSFGPNCIYTCDCNNVTSTGCNSSSGDCICDSGDKCDQSVCVANNTLNCLPLDNVPCDQFYEACNGSDVPGPSLRKDMLNICCHREASPAVSLCIAKGGCKCRPGYKSQTCDEAAAEKTGRHTLQVLTTVGVVGLAAVGLAAAIFIGIFVWRRRVSINKNETSMCNPEQQETQSSGMEITQVTYDILQRPGQRSAASDQLEMCTTDRSNPDIYGHSANALHSENDQNETYSSAIDDETYNHLERDSRPKHAFCSTEDTYSHVRSAITDGNEYGRVGGHDIPVDMMNVYDHTESHHQLYSNAEDLNVRDTGTEDCYV